MRRGCYAININDYYFSMNKVYEYIDENIDEDLSLRTLSSVSGYSGYHFHRIFRAMTGKTLHEYVMERRIITASERLLYEHVSITQIAFDCGFSSYSNFIRCFKKYFGCSPSDYRNNKKRKRPVKSKDIEFKKYKPDHSLDSLFSVVLLPDLHVAGIISRGLSENFESGKIEKSFKKLFIWLSKSNLIKKDMSVMGITLDTPEVVSFAECRYFACVPADENFKSSGEISVRTFHTKGEYIKFSLERTKSDFAKTFFDITDYLYGCYMPNMLYYPDNRPFAELYEQNDSKMIINFHIPVKDERHT